MDCRTALLTILDQVDYTNGACRVNEMVGAVLPKEVITLCRQAVEQSVQADLPCTCEKFENGSKVFPMRECDGCRKSASR